MSPLVDLLLPVLQQPRPIGKASRTQLTRERVLHLHPHLLNHPLTNRSTVPLMLPQLSIVAKLLLAAAAPDAGNLPYNDRYRPIDNGNHLPMVGTHQVCRHLEVTLTLKLTEAAPKLAPTAGYARLMLARPPMLHEVVLAVRVEPARLTLERSLQHDAVHVFQHHVKAVPRVVQHPPVVVARDQMLAEQVRRQPRLTDGALGVVAFALSLSLVPGGGGVRFFQRLYDGATTSTTRRGRLH
uniref:Uncharacterized protein n=1 Tax=Anopheles coluzzii TaxID=1518534 RepID=A0A8W7Q0S3_ANOCL